ncbi:MAG: MetS family NSS transporter small subunit [Thermoplasmata archaeon]|nr:MetS family NSS transporter small subunit [Thermoplasmata archaeon]
MMLSYDAIGMLVFGVAVLYGGLAYFIYRALKSRRE